MRERGTRQSMNGIVHCGGSEGDSCCGTSLDRPMLGCAKHPDKPNWISFRSRPRDWHLLVTHCPRRVSIVKTIMMKPMFREHTRMYFWRNMTRVRIEMLHDVCSTTREVQQRTQRKEVEIGTVFREASCSHDVGPQRTSARLDNETVA